jgi:hypothetical protein
MKALNLSKINFTQKSDVVNPGKEIYNPRFSYVDTSKGHDQIIGTSHITGDFALGAFVGVVAEEGKAIANLNGQATVANYGIKNEGIINTNNGQDIVRGRATANISAIADTVSVAIAIAEKTDATAIANAFADLKVKATADGIDNSSGVIYTGKGSDSVSGDTEGSIAAVATATADASVIVEAICKAPMSEGLTAFAQAMAISLAEGTITATGIKNIGGIITTGQGEDTLSASATSTAGAGSFATTNSSAYANASPENQALAKAVAYASAKATDKAIAIDNSRGWIDTGHEDDTIEATAKATDKAIAIDNSRGWITTGHGNDTIIAKASGNDTYGIFGGNIHTGKGSDQIIASSFGGGVNINLGEDNDLIQGFGNARVDGGQGRDTLSLGSYNKDNFQISLGNNNRVSFELDGITLTTTGFEQFNFANNVSYTSDELKWG